MIIAAGEAGLAKHIMYVVLEFETAEMQMIRWMCGVSMRQKYE